MCFGVSSVLPQEEAASCACYLVPKSPKAGGRRWADSSEKQEHQTVLVIISVERHLKGASFWVLLHGGED